MTPPRAWTGILATLPASARVMLTAFLLIVTAGYGLSVLTIYTTHEKADGLPGLSMEDIRAVYRGATAPAPGGPVPSRMLTMIEGQMRQYIEDDRDFQVLQDWLRAGGRQEALDSGQARRTPRRILVRNCLRCHAESTGTDISRKAPFGTDEFDIAYEKLAAFLAPDPARGGGATRLPPQYSVPRLILFSHYHMLGMPMFTLVVGLMFMCTRTPPRIRSFLTPLPMVSLVVDFSGWWLARVADAFVYVIAATGAVFGAALGIQLIVLFVELWRPAQSIDDGAGVSASRDRSG